eukprot:m.56877 g.56877  ORF g.56877 m.56877 type:complete len:113 (-) comp13037_c0_seq1:63-401(-)
MTRWWQINETPLPFLCMVELTAGYTTSSPPPPSPSCSLFFLLFPPSKAVITHHSSAWPIPFRQPPAINHWTRQSSRKATGGRLPVMFISFAFDFISSYFHVLSAYLFPSLSL